MLFSHAASCIVHGPHVINWSICSSVPDHWCASSTTTAMAGERPKTSAEQPVHKPSVAVDPIDSTEQLDAGTTSNDTACKSSAALTTQTESSAAQPAIQSTKQLCAGSTTQRNDEGNNKRSKTSAEQPVHKPSVAVDEDAEETCFLKAFYFRRPDGQPQRLGVNMLRRYVERVPPQGSKHGQTFEQIIGYCKTAWKDMQTDGIWTEDYWALEALEPHELAALSYVSPVGQCCTA